MPFLRNLLAWATGFKDARLEDEEMEIDDERMEVDDDANIAVLDAIHQRVMIFAQESVAAMSQDLSQYEVVRNITRYGWDPLRAHQLATALFDRNQPSGQPEPFGSKPYLLLARTIASNQQEAENLLAEHLQRLDTSWDRDEYAAAREVARELHARGYPLDYLDAYFGELLGDEVEDLAMALRVGVGRRDPLELLAEWAPWVQAGDDRDGSLLRGHREQEQTNEAKFVRLFSQEFQDLTSGEQPLGEFKNSWSPSVAWQIVNNAYYTHHQDIPTAKQWLQSYMKDTDPRFAPESFAKFWQDGHKRLLASVRDFFAFLDEDDLVTLCEYYSKWFYAHWPTGWITETIVNLNKRRKLSLVDAAANVNQDMENLTPNVAVLNWVPELASLLYPDASDSSSVTFGRERVPVEMEPNAFVHDFAQEFVDLVRGDATVGRGPMYPYEAWRLLNCIFAATFGQGLARAKEALLEHLQSDDDVHILNQPGTIQRVQDDTRLMYSGLSADTLDPLIEDVIRWYRDGWPVRWIWSMLDCPPEGQEFVTDYDDSRERLNAELETFNKHDFTPNHVLFDWIPALMTVLEEGGVDVDAACRWLLPAVPGPDSPVREQADTPYGNFDDINDLYGPVAGTWRPAEELEEEVDDAEIKDVGDEGVAEADREANDIQEALDEQLMDFAGESDTEDDDELGDLQSQNVDDAEAEDAVDEDGSAEHGEAALDSEDQFLDEQLMGHADSSHTEDDDELLTALTAALEDGEIPDDKQERLTEKHCRRLLDAVMNRRTNINSRGQFSANQAWYFSEGSVGWLTELRKWGWDAFHAHLLIDALRRSGVTREEMDEEVNNKPSDEMWAITLLDASVQSFERAYPGAEHVAIREEAYNLYQRGYSVDFLTECLQTLDRQGISVTLWSRVLAAIPSWHPVGEWLMLWCPRIREVYPEFLKDDSIEDGFKITIEPRKSSKTVIVRRFHNEFRDLVTNWNWSPAEAWFLVTAAYDETWHNVSRAKEIIYTSRDNAPDEVMASYAGDREEALKDYYDEQDESDLEILLTCYRNWYQSFWPSLWIDEKMEDLELHQPLVAAALLNRQLEELLGMAYTPSSVLLEWAPELRTTLNRDDERRRERALADIDDDMKIVVDGDDWDEEDEDDELYASDEENASEDSDATMDDDDEEENVEMPLSPEEEESLGYDVQGLHSRRSMYRRRSDEVLRANTDFNANYPGEDGERQFKVQYDGIPEYRSPSPSPREGSARSTVPFPKSRQIPAPLRPSLKSSWSPKFGAPSTIHRRTPYGLHLFRPSATADSFDINAPVNPNSPFAPAHTTRVDSPKSASSKTVSPRSPKPDSPKDATSSKSPSPKSSEFFTPQSSMSPPPSSEMHFPSLSQSGSEKSSEQSRRSSKTASSLPSLYRSSSADSPAPEDNSPASSKTLSRRSSEHSPVSSRTASLRSHTSHTRPVDSPSSTKTNWPESSQAPSPRYSEHSPVLSKTASRGSSKTLSDMGPPDSPTPRFSPTVAAPHPPSPLGPTDESFEEVMSRRPSSSPPSPPLNPSQRQTPRSYRVAKSTFKDYRVKKVDPLRYSNKLDQPHRLPDTPTKSHLPPSPRRSGPKKRPVCETCGRAFRVTKKKKKKKKKKGGKTSHMKNALAIAATANIPDERPRTRSVTRSIANAAGIPDEELRRRYPIATSIATAADNPDEQPRRSRRARRKRRRYSDEY
ncbi:uncharacterized protein CLAFUR5_08928 [Fulvia fulva]|uniref:Uncharacterized protein n=1 Tax=Passalora fulva TaxID=5499 RepID=A0A9Q8PG20_PASFU|nr:uncharacterized protein CLAFUR5_08928 [Fulvia fulva]UJO21755.1 hypothetical protein CLAFUR5_08928 [Fulvia fulva]